MRYVLLCFILCLLFCINVQAIDDYSYYGDGVSVSFSDIRSSLPSLYKNTPNITVSTQSGSITYSFNVEMFVDKGYLVYGNPTSIADIGYTNSFKSKTNGYFYSSGYGSTRGEYRYLGLSISGSVYTNNSFPSDTVPGDHEYRVVKYSSLPDYLKDRYGITEDGNTYFEGIRSIIDSANSPAWDFVHNYSNGSKVTVYEKFKDSGLVGNGVEPASIFDYARITGWGSGGGSLVLYYRSITDSSVYRYATFTGDVNPIWAKAFPGLSCNIDLESLEYKLDANSEEVNVEFKVIGMFYDDYVNLNNVLKQYTYTRDDIRSYSLYGQNVLRNTENLNYRSDKVIFTSETVNLTLKRENLKAGYNTISVTGSAKVNADGCVFSSECTENIIVFVEPKVMQTPTPSKTPSPTPTPTSENTSVPSVKRRW